MGRRMAAIFVFAGLLPVASVAAPLLSEVFYDATGSDNGYSFVEIWGGAGMSLDGLTLEGVNGSNGAITHSIMLSGVIPADGIFVLADDVGDGTTLVANADLIRNFDFQNGPDSVVLRGAGGGVLDALGYGLFGVSEVFAGEGAPAPDAPAGSALARIVASIDTDDNLADFEVAPASPGVAPVPEPTTVVLLAMGLLGLAWAGRG
jgi:hypothetical protein